LNWPWLHLDILTKRAENKKERGKGIASTLSETYRTDHSGAGRAGRADKNTKYGKIVSESYLLFLFLFFLNSN